MSYVILLAIDTRVDTYVDLNRCTSIGMRTGTRAHGVQVVIGRRPPVRCEQGKAAGMSDRFGSHDTVRVRTMADALAECGSMVSRRWSAVPDLRARRRGHRSSLNK